MAFYIVDIMRRNVLLLELRLLGLVDLRHLNLLMAIGWSALLRCVGVVSGRLTSLAEIASLTATSSSRMSRNSPLSLLRLLSLSQCSEATISLRRRGT